VPRLPRRLVPRVVAATVALIGAVVTALGALYATSWAPEQEVSAQISGTGDEPVVTTETGVLALAGKRVRVDATAAGRPVFLGIGRANDVESYLGKVSRVDVDGQDGKGSLLAETTAGDDSVPDPAGVDVWTVSTRTQNRASLVWPDTPGQWRLVAATDGGAKAPALSLTWTADKRTSVAPALVAVGVLLLVGGGVTFAMLVSRRSLQDDGPPPTPPSGYASGYSPRREARRRDAAGDSSRDNEWVEL
jgi:hypothetical protein